jgi:hypothetical protein
MPRPQFSLKTMLWIGVGAVVTLAGLLYLAPRAGLSPVEFLVIVVIAIFLFGPKLPRP